MKKDLMKQKILLEMHSGEKKTINITKLMDGFPLSNNDISAIS
jgi:hypothetical protein